MPKYLDVRGGVIHGTLRVEGRGMTPPPGSVPVPDDFDLVGVEGRTYDAQTGVLGPPTRSDNVIGLRDFFRLFAPEEMADIAFLRDAGDAGVGMFYELAILETTIDLLHADVGRGLALLQATDSPLRVGEKVLTAARAAEIAAGTPPGGGGR